jgi:hypothetical protein
MITLFCDYVPHGPVSSWTNDQIAFHLADVRRTRRDFGAFEHDLLAEAEARLPGVERSIALVLVGFFVGMIFSSLIAWLA